MLELPVNEVKSRCRKLMQWGFLTGRPMIVLFWLSLGAGCLLPDVTVEDREPGSTTKQPDAGGRTADSSAKPNAVPGSMPGPGSTGDGPIATESPDAGAPRSESAAAPTKTEVDPTPTGAGTGICCDDGNCLCHGPEPTELTSEAGPYASESYELAGTGCVYYPKDAPPPYAAVSIADGFGGTGGCGSAQTGQWGPLYASWGIVAMIVSTGAGDQPNPRGQKLLKGIAAFRAEHMRSGSPLEGKLAGRYGTSGFSMGGGGTSYASRDDTTLLTSVAIMPWGPLTSGLTVPTLVICGSTDGTAPCASHGDGLYRGVDNMTPKMRVQIASGHAGQPGADLGKSGKYALAFQKVYLEGDQRWRPLLVAADSEETNIK